MFTARRVLSIVSTVPETVTVCFGSSLTCAQLGKARASIAANALNNIVLRFMFVSFGCPSLLLRRVSHSAGKGTHPRYAIVMPRRLRVKR
jgi:hypothetical protein